MWTFALLLSAASPGATVQRHVPADQLLTEPLEQGEARLLWPSLGVPALAQPGEVLEIELAAECPADLTDAWLVLVGAQLPLRVPVEVTGPRSVRVPLSLADDTYHLQVALEGCEVVRGTAPVRVVRDGGTGLVAVLTDEQLGDPLTSLPPRELEGSLHPQWVKGEVAASRRLQVRAELAFRHPDLVLYPGDVVFGMDFAAEYPATQELWSSTPLAIFAVPGNHDAYALHRMELAGSWKTHALGALTCGARLAGLGWQGVLLGTGDCLVDSLGESLSLELEEDGLVAWRRTMGSEAWAFSWRGVRFVGFNTYEGSVARRTAVPISPRRLQDLVGRPIPGLSSLDPELGAPLTDNFGGLVSEETSAWVIEEAAAARERGEGVVLVAHHDPTGAFKGEPAVKPVEPFGTDPVASGGFETWNYDPAAGETATDHSGSRLLEALSEGALPTWILGHTHLDSEQAPTLYQTTTGGSDVMSTQGYRGYGLLQVDQGSVVLQRAGLVESWFSTPLGHLWIEDLPREDGPPDQTVVSGYPEPISGRLRFVLPPPQGGYRLLVDGEPTPPVDLVDGGAALALYVDVEAPPGRGAPVARAEDQLARLPVRWEAVPEHEPAVEIGGRLRPRKGLPFCLEATSDTPVLRAVWTIDEARSSGASAEWTPEERGRVEVSVVSWDQLAGRAEASEEVRVRMRWPWSRAHPCGD